ncbi:MAG: AEC family transporter [Oscillospiraceae bacterium]|jgi:predicted permease|nr:AEC family transporter [Oscillospiraceae bacterium]
MSEVISKMIMLVALMFIGYFCAKLKITGPEFNKNISAVMMDVFLSATILNSVINVEPTMSNGEIFYIVLLFGLMMAIAIALSWLTVKLLRVPKSESGIIMCLVTYMNTAFVGFPIVETVYGPEAVFYASLSGIPFNLIIYSVGTITLCGGATGEKIPLKKIFTPPLVVTLIGAVIFAFRIPFPKVVEDTVSTLAGATIPISMLIIGTSLGAIPIKAAVTNWRIYLVSLIRLLVCPIVTYFLLSLFVSNEVIVGIITIEAATPAAMVLAVLCIQYDLDDSIASEGIFISTVMSMVTIPFVIWLLL